jgi:hypothetical protein
MKPHPGMKTWRMNMQTLQRNRGLLLLAMLAGMILFYPVMEIPSAPLHALETLATGGLLALMFLYRPPRAAWWISLLSSLLAIGFTWITLPADSAGLLTSSHLYRLAPLMILIGLILHRVMSAGPMNADRLYGTLCVFLLFGLVWANFYVLLGMVRPDSFRFAQDLPAGRDVFFREMIYYSYVTLLTVGYGDIVPVHPLARALSILESLTGILFTAVAISRMSGALQVEEHHQPGSHHHPHGKDS